MLTYADECRRMLTYADVCGRMEVLASRGLLRRATLLLQRRRVVDDSECEAFVSAAAELLDAAGQQVCGCSRTLTYDDVCWRMLTYADVC